MRLISNKKNCQIISKHQHHKLSEEVYMHVFVPLSDHLTQNYITGGSQGGGGGYFTFASLPQTNASHPPDHNFPTPFILPLVIVPNHNPPLPIFFSPHSHPFNHCFPSTPLLFPTPSTTNSHPLSTLPYKVVVKEIKSLNHSLKY